MKNHALLTHTRNAFSMIELIFVIVILGIVASIGSEVIAKTYESYINQRTLHNASLKTELAATQIANRLARAVPGTIVRRVSKTSAATPITYSGHTGDTILQWVGADIDSFDEGGWSGLIDLNTTASPENNNKISTPGSKLGTTKKIIKNLKGDVNGSCIYFRRKGILESRIIQSFISSSSTISFQNSRLPLAEHYKLAWTSYALEVVDKNNDGKGDLTLHYRFPPIVDQNITGHQSSILLRNVTTFEFRGDGNAVRFKLCVRESPTGIKLDDTIICKEKAVF